MARYLGPTCKLSRREGTDLFLKSGIRPLESKCRADSVPVNMVRDVVVFQTMGYSCEKNKKCDEHTEFLRNNFETITKKQRSSKELQVKHF